MKLCKNCPPPDPNLGVTAAVPHVCLNSQCECDRSDVHYISLPTEVRVHG